MQILIISDTHDLLRDPVVKLLGQCDAVIHAGDISSRNILNDIRRAMKRTADLYVVRGNNDKSWAMDLPLVREFELEGVHFLVTHEKKNIPKNLGDCGIVIFGHSHKYYEEIKDGRLWHNPGSCGKRRFHQEITMSLLELEAGKWKLEKLSIDHETGDVTKGIHTSPAEKPPAAGLSLREQTAVIAEIMKRMDKRQSVEMISSRMHLDAEFVETVCRIYVTHPGVTAEGILSKMEVNHLRER